MSIEKPRKEKNGKPLFIVSALLLLAVISFFVFILIKDTPISAQSPEIVKASILTEDGEVDFNAILMQLSQRMLLPQEEPFMAEINDVEAAREENSVFYASAKNGNILIMFSQLAIIYDSNIDYIVNVAPVIYPEQPELPAQENVQQ